MLKIPEDIYQRLFREAVKHAPLEACGLLAGKNNVVTEFYPLTNVDKSSEHFSMDPVEQFAAVREMRRHGWEIVAIWHSHPATPPRMSEEDKKLAYMPNVSYAILSLAEEHRGKLRAFRRENGDFSEQQIEIIKRGRELNA
ncbi:Mov34/MPN/PAD-1 family protein [Zhaonella formicivorans]|jgi:proteasome lid subunit RPN8/RPN11|uniref:Mov34/MPN/PAD-1 family protein n=1 Tax=Zhaonella formicivorans TaxID=2528593 RepID=UPI0010F0A3AE|nr:M67 family metallopeptidase [Zhaonella formicivorans]